MNKKRQYHKKVLVLLLTYLLHGSFVPKMSASIKSYIVQIIYIVSAWILYPLHFSLLPLI